MNILFINPPLSLEDRYGKLKAVGPCQEPLGIAYLAASIIKERGDDVEILDAEALNLSSQEVQKHVSARNYDVIGITMTTPGYFRVIELVKSIHEVSDASIHVGGPHPTVMPIETLHDNHEIDIAVLGEGEKTIVDVLNTIERDGDLSEVKGIAYREGDKIIVTEKRPFIKELDTIPMPARHLLPMHLYRPAPSYYKKLPSYAVISARGCPFRCTFCCSLFGRKLRSHSPERICDEMEYLMDEYGAKEIIFRTDTFTINRNHTVDLCQEIIRRGLHKRIEWTCETRVNVVDKPLLELMRKAGCWEIHYGVETGSQRLLDLIQKDITLEQVKQAFKWTQEAGIAIKAFFMLGLPTETREDSSNTIKFSKQLNPEWAQFTLTTPYPGTKLYDQAKETGYLKSFNWKNYKTWGGFTQNEVPYVTRGRTSGELKKLQRRALKEFYFRPKIILKHLLKIRSFASFKNYIRGALALI